jgi:hypothetical protein
MGLRSTQTEPAQRPAPRGCDSSEPPHGLRRCYASGTKFLARSTAPGASEL